MKKTIKCGIVAAVAVAAGFAAYQSYGSYGAQDNSLLMQNVEALAADDKNGEPDTKGDPGSGGSYRMAKCYWDEANSGTNEGYICPAETNIPNVIKECPTDTKRIDVTVKKTAYCLKKN